MHEPHDIPHEPNRPGADASPRPAGGHAGDEPIDEHRLLESIAEIERQIGAFRHAHEARTEDERAFAALCAELVRARESRDAWEESWQAAQTEADNADTQWRRSRDALAERAQQIELLQARLSDAQTHPVRAPDAGAPPSVDGFNELRRARLKRLRALVQDEAGKLSLAEELLAKRLQAIEEKEAQHAQLRSATERLAIERESYRVKLEESLAQLEQIAAQPKPAPIVHAPPRGRFGTSLATALLGLASVAGLSWHLAGEFETAEHIAEMRLSPEFGVESGSEETIESWFAYHEALVADPQVLGLASERMARRGLVSLAEPAALRSRLEQNLDVMRADGPSLTLTLRGIGSDPTRRVLETLGLTIVSYANDTRDYRKDRVSTVISAGAASDGRAVATNRLELFGIFAGATVMVGLLLALVAKRISRPVKVPERSGDETYRPTVM